jgi:hypothetical protein
MEVDLVPPDAVPNRSTGEHVLDPDGRTQGVVASTPPIGQARHQSIG